MKFNIVIMLFKFFLNLKIKEQYQENIHNQENVQSLNSGNVKCIITWRNYCY